MASKIAQATAAQVREFASEQGIEVGKRGRFKPSLVEAFNEANKGQMRYVEGAEVATIPLKVKVTSAKTGKVRTETKMFTRAEVRSLAAEGGVPSLKGPLSDKVKEAAAAAYKG